MSIFKNRVARLFEERIADLFRTMMELSMRTADMVDPNNILVKLEIWTFMFALLDYMLVGNRVDANIRKGANLMFDQMFSLSQNWSQLPAIDLRRFSDDRLNNYRDLLNDCNGVNPDFLIRVADYQTELIAWIIKEHGVRMGFVAVPKQKADYEPIETDLLLVFKIKTALSTCYSGYFFKYVNLLRKNANDSYFTDRSYILQT